MRKIRCIFLILAASLMLFLCGCTKEQGRSDPYPGYTVKTEKTREIVNAEK